MWQFGIQIHISFVNMFPSFAVKALLIFTYVMFLGSDSRDPLGEMFIVDCRVKAPQKFDFFFLTLCNQKPNHTLNMLNMHVKLSFMRNYTISNVQSCCVLVWSLGSAVSLLTGVQD